ncbi:MAG: ABC transporter permease [Treponema sp.]|nr:MAG: ABC transporter permease [Treponema sp.]
MNIKFNPTPITKLAVTVFLAFSIIVPQNEIYINLTVLFIALFFALNSRKISALKAVIFYGTITLIVMNANNIQIQFIKNYILPFLFVIKIFFIPVFAGHFFISTSEVSSIIASFEKMRLPRTIIIPLAVMFRYFPSFHDDKKNIKMAMKMRGISFKNPIRYLEFISIPLLISAVNIADDISKAAETKCISDPCKKTRYTKITISIADIVFALGILSLNIIGRVYA